MRSFVPFLISGTILLSVGAVAGASGCSSSSGGGAPVDDTGVAEAAADVAAESAADAGGVVVTSSTCGAIPVLGAQGTQNTAACKTCVDTSCCTEGAACGSDPECVTYRQCAAACADATCSNACYDAHPDAGKTSDPFATCRRTRCSQPCAALSCVGAVTWPAPATATLDMTFVLQSYKDGAPIAGATVRACAKTDATCASPLATGTTDATGTVQLAMPTSPAGFAAYLEATATGYTKTLTFVQFADNAKTLAAKKLYLTSFDEGTFAGFGALAGATLDPTRGHVAFGAFDCNGNRVAGVSVATSTADAQSVTTYVVGSGPSDTAKETDPSGAGGVFNVPVGAATLTGTLQPSKTTLGKSDVLLRAGWVTTVNVTPSP